MAFFFLTLLFMYIGRKLGWSLSRSVLYTAPVAAAVVLALALGVLVAFGMRGLLNWQQPGAVLRWIMGYALGAYVSIPNYGLLVPSSIPEAEVPRHNLISSVPELSYLATTIALAFFVPYGT